MSRRQNTDRGRAGRRWVITLSVIALVLVSAVLVLRRDDRINRAQATLIANGVSGIARGVVSTLGELDLHARPDWTGIRVYDREKNTWLTLEEGAPIGSYPVLLIHGLDEPGPAARCMASHRASIRSSRPVAHPCRAPSPR